jgi:H+/Cl- antiporter ClcA
VSDSGEVRTEVSIRRAPKYLPFVLVGAVVGLIIALVVTSLYPADPTVGLAAILGYFGIIGFAIGALIGAIVALVLDRISSRRARTVAAELTIQTETLPEAD